MKKLYIIRHAKSSWDNIDMDDFNRPLNDRGEKDAPHMAKVLRQREVFPDRMVSSPAVRALKTCKAFAKVLDFDKHKIITVDKLYHASPEVILSVLSSLKEHPHDKEDIAFIFGHNPGITEFANQLLNVHIDNIPTCGVVSATLKIKLWSEIIFGCGVMDAFEYPKKN